MFLSCCGIIGLETLVFRMELSRPLEDLNQIGNNYYIKLTSYNTFYVVLLHIYKLPARL